MAFEHDAISQLIAQRCLYDFKPELCLDLPVDAASNRQIATSRYLQSCTTDAAANAGMPMDCLNFLDLPGDTDFSALLDFRPEELLDDTFGREGNKRKASETNSESSKKFRQDSPRHACIDPHIFDNLLGTFPLGSSECSESELIHPDISNLQQDTSSSYGSLQDSKFARQNDGDMTRASSPCSDTSEQSVCGNSAEYHFQKIEEHIQLALSALKQGRFEHQKNIVSWAHDLKNKTFSELKKEAINLRDSMKDKEVQPIAKPKALHGSTKRVEQFRKNMRRWMIGTQAHQIGVEWMVYARMEHLQAICKFVLGDGVPLDPASPTAVAESIMKQLDQDIPLEFVDQQLAEPEPGKRYTIGSQLAEALQARCPRKVPTLAFTMPPDSDQVALSSWVAQLKALFPAKPAPKNKAKSKTAS